MAKRTFTGRSGIAATEFALTLPIVLLFALACADFGRISFYEEVVSNAARTGAETGATHKYTDFTYATWAAGVEQAVLDEMQNIPNFDSNQLGYDLTTSEDADGLARIVVEVTYPFRTVVSWPVLPTEVQLHQRFETRQFR